MKLFEAHYKHRWLAGCSISVIFTFRLLSLEEFHSRKTLESAAWAAEQGPSAPEPKTIYDIEVKNAQGETVPLSVSFRLSDQIKGCESFRSLLFLGKFHKYTL